MLRRGMMAQAASGGGSYLDSLAVTPRMALSMKKKLISTATSALRVRESAGNTEQDIGFSGALVDSAALASFVGANSGFLHTLYDQTGNSENAVQATSANQPRLINAGVADAMATFDGSNDGLSISSLTTGAAQLGIYLKFKMPTGPGAKLIFELSPDFNTASYAMLVYCDPGSANPLVVSVHSVYGFGYRTHTYAVSAGASVQLSILVDRSLTGAGEIAVWQGGTLLTATPTGPQADQSGVFGNYDAYIGSRGGSSLFSDMALESLVTYNADTSAIRTAIEAILA